MLWAANEGGTVAHANAVKTLGLGGKVFVFGTDMNNQMGQMLQASDDILQGVTGQAPYQMGYDALATAMDVLGGKQVAEVTNTPTIFFGRGQDALIKQFMDTEGKAIFEVPAENAAPQSSAEPDAEQEADRRGRRIPVGHVHADRASRHAGRGRQDRVHADPGQHGQQAGQRSVDDRRLHRPQGRCDRHHADLG